MMIDHMSYKVFVYLNITEYKVLCRFTVTTALHCINQKHLVRS